jgi:hypothetical protein
MGIAVVRQMATVLCHRSKYIQDIQLMVICICTLYMMYTIIKVHVRFKF